MSARRHLSALCSVIFIMFFFQVPCALALEWITDLGEGLDEAEERGAPVFIFLCQST